MQFIDQEKFMPEFIERTLTNLRWIENSEPATYEVTQLLNSFTGLLVLPHQKVQDSIEDSDISSDLLHKIQSSVRICLDCSKRVTDKSLKNIVRHLRNGICHWHVQFCGSTEIEAIQITDQITDQYTERPIITVFEAQFDIDLLRKFVVEFGTNTKNKHSENHK